MMGKNGVSMFRGQFFSVIRCTCLKNNRASLRRAANIERTGHLEEIAVVIKRMQFCRVKELPALFVAHKGISLPGIPESFHHVEVFIRYPVAQRMFRVFLAREVFRRPLQR
ncbi:Uncharacterised protein [Enterobacter ludwigii]|nr:Uncharacterised protein [Enterobacter ludwigii]